MFKKTFIYSVSSGLLVLLNTGIIDHANAQKPGHVYVETKVGIDGKLLPATIDCTDQTYDIKGDGLAWMSIYQERKSRESILQEYINLCGANKGSVYRFYIKLMEGDIDNRLYVVWRQSPEGLKWEQQEKERRFRDAINRTFIYNGMQESLREKDCEKIGLMGSQRLWCDLRRKPTLDYQPKPTQGNQPFNIRINPYPAPKYPAPDLIDRLRCQEWQKLGIQHPLHLRCGPAVPLRRSGRSSSLLSRHVEFNP